MESERTEGARTETTAVVDDGKFHFLNSRDASERLVHRMICPFIGKLIDPVEVLGSDGTHRRILHKNYVAVALDNLSAVYRVLFVLLDPAGYRVFSLGSAHLLKRRTFRNRRRHILFHGDCHTGSANVGDTGNVLAGRKAIGYLNHGVLAHTERQNIRP